MQDRAVLRAAPRDSGQEQALLWQGETVEVRGERLDYLQIYDHRRERAGFVRASQVRRVDVTPDAAPELLSVVRFLRDTPGSEALGIAFAAAYIEAAPADVLAGPEGIDALDALGTLADRLARRASSAAPRTKAASEALAAHLEAASRYGVNFASYERDGRIVICYDGEAHRRVLAMPSSAEHRARAALALTRPECFDRELRPLERYRTDVWRAEVLDRVDVARLSGYSRNRIAMSRASVWASLAYQRMRMGESATAAAQRALAELATVDKSQLTDDDRAAYNDAAMRVAASRWGAAPAAAATTRNPQIVATRAQSGETCIELIEIKGEARKDLARRCTYGIVWTNSVSLNREGNALTLAVQPMESWREIWVFRKDAGAWTISVLPPAATSPNLGYVEFAGWVPGGKEMLLAREARGDGKYRRSFEVVSLDTLATLRQASDPAGLSSFKRWQDPAWKRDTVSTR
ncbi:MAG TPA: hypothetical protein VFJ68_11655 [Casimicrobiaceae bacterium]|nr:hypothetical protein [Casimicrobiaceae bacterium]